MLKIERTNKFKREFKKLPEPVKKEFEKQLKRLLEKPNPPFHPSLRIKKVQGTDGIFEATIIMGVRMTWQFTKNGILLRNIGEHDKTLKNS
jgi:mRNA-degrading endonuclease YafQ of YafQ-DinJ toxin-antitoxin module